MYCKAKILQIMYRQMPPPHRERVSMGGLSAQPTAITSQLNYCKGQQHGSSCQDVAIRGGISSVGDHTGGKDTGNKPINRVGKK